jgi:heptosyltransferase-3
MAVTIPGLIEGDVRRICIIRLRRLGDVVMMTPCLPALRRWRPSATIAVVVTRPLDQLLEGNPNVDEVIALPRQGWRYLPRAALQMRRRRFDVVFNFHGGSTSAWLTLASGAPVRVGATTFRHRFAYNVTANPLRGEDETGTVHYIERRMRLLEAVGVPPVPAPLELHVSGAARERMREQLARLKLGDGARLALIRPAVLHEAKRWPTERFAAVADWLAQERGVRCVLNIGPGEEATGAAFERAAHREHARIDTPTPQDLMALIEAAALVVGNDTGPTHIAAALGTPVVAIFGASDPACTAPRGGFVRVVRHQLPCWPCRKWKCTIPDRHLCLRAVGVTDVQAAIDDLLQQPARAERSSD